MCLNHQNMVLVRDFFPETKSNSWKLKFKTFLFTLEDAEFLPTFLGNRDKLRLYSSFEPRQALYI